MITAPYTTQAASWPKTGRHILAHHDADSLYVYQAYRPSIARYATEHQRFGGEHFSYARMSWIKPNFLWMMYRCGWATQPGQEHVLAVRLRRTFFDELLRLAISSSFDPNRYASHEHWKRALTTSEVRLQWDPDHDPWGKPLQRRAIQLGLRGEMLHRYGNDAILSVQDITPFVTEQAQNLNRGIDDLNIPDERIYCPDNATARAAGLDAPH
jgi:hypothetical protein